MLHRLNPVRLRYIREQIDAQWTLDPKVRRPLAGKAVLDIGCGAGLLSEPLARLGATVTGVDAASENVNVARAHSVQSGLAIEYLVGETGAVAGRRFDVITCLEVIEHVGDVASFVAALGASLAQGGLLILSTPNRTALSRVALIGIGESIGGIPAGTHDWADLLTPDELTEHLTSAKLEVKNVRGLFLGPVRGFHLSDTLALDYFVTAQAMRA